MQYVGGVHKLDNTVQEAIKRPKGECFVGRKGGLAFAVTVYCIWCKRTQKIFRNCTRDVSYVVKEIDRFICAKVWHWKTSRAFVNWLVCKNWGIGKRILV